MYHESPSPSPGFNGCFPKRLLPRCLSPRPPLTTHASECKWAFSKASRHSLQKLSAQPLHGQHCYECWGKNSEQNRQNTLPREGYHSKATQAGLRHKTRSLSCSPQSHSCLPAAVTNFANFTAGLTMIWRHLTTFYICAQD